MKRSLLLVLLLGVMLVFAACAGDNAAVPEGTDPGDKADDPEAPITEQVIGSPEDLTNALGVTVTLPDTYEATRYAVIDDVQAQVEFMVGENQAIARVAQGQQDNMSGLTGQFDNTETVEVNGVSATVRYPAADKTVMYAAQSVGVIDAYDAAADASYSVSILTNATKDDLVAALTALMQGTTLAAK